MKLLRGQVGYINKTKRKHLLYAVLFFLCVLIFYIIGKTINSDYYIYLFVVSALLVLPTAQQLTKYLVFFNYKSITKELYEKYDKISIENVVLSELVVVYGKKTYFLKLVVLNNNEINVLIKNKNKYKNIKSDLEKVINSKKYKLIVNIFDNEEEMYTYTKQNAYKSKYNEKELEEIATLLLQNSI